MLVEPVWTNTSVSQRILPLLASRQTARREGLPFSVAITAVVTYRRPRRNTGEDQPTPGISARQTMFEELVQFSGIFRALEIPCPPGPRNWGQSTAEPALSGSLPLLWAVKGFCRSKQSASMSIRRQLSE